MRQTSGNRLLEMRHPGSPVSGPEAVSEGCARFRAFLSLRSSPVAAARGVSEEAKPGRLHQDDDPVTRPGSSFLRRVQEAERSRISGHAPVTPALPERDSGGMEASGIEASGIEASGMEIEVWSDFACPWCALGLARLRIARSRLEHGDEVRVAHRSYELDPRAPARRELSMEQAVSSQVRDEPRAGPGRPGPARRARPRGGHRLRLRPCPAGQHLRRPPARRRRHAVKRAKRRFSGLSSTPTSPRDGCSRTMVSCGRSPPQPASTRSWPTGCSAGPCTPRRCATTRRRPRSSGSPACPSSSSTAPGPSPERRTSTRW